MTGTASADAGGGGLRSELADGVLRLTFDRPARLNAVDTPTMTALADQLERAAHESAIRVVVIAGTGRAFCTGADLAGGGMDPVAAMDVTSRAIRAIVAAPVPVIAAVHGPAAGVGVSIALASDLAYMAESAYLLLSFTSIGLMPDGASSLFVAAAMGRARAHEMILRAPRVGGPEAATSGLVAGCVADDELDAHVDEAVARFAHGPRRALELTKRALTATTLADLDAVLSREKDGQVELLRSADFAEGARAAMEKRPPNFA